MLRVDNGVASLILAKAKEGQVPKGPSGEKRPADVIGCAVRVMEIATGQVEETPTVSGRRRSGQAGAKARAQNLNAETRSEIARKAAAARWG